ncbi:tetratricopeptide repeat protein [Acetobacter sp. LMG 1636]|uniref:Tetratricopeptide repeat protein n=2 Tax=Acetobacter fallax TaxID=1737473 RepID=A0ABX0KH26_9PROT|nr:tetratricopeptide repeat protein [Acetobacter fallax]NHO37281.1 tetratricopeptide repeat protein [Acetobacter fallax]
MLSFTAHFQQNRVRGCTAGLLTTAAVLLFCPLTGHAQVSSREGIALQDQIMELKQQLSQVQSSSASTGGSLPAPVAAGSQSSGSGSDLTAQLLDRVNTLEEQNREMHGQIDELTNQLKEQSASLSKQMGDMQFAMQNGKGSAPAPVVAKEKETAASAHAETTGAHETQTPESYLKAGNAALNQRDYAGAQQNARSVIEHGKGTVKVDGQFLLGQSLAGQKQYGQAAAAYYDAYKQAPKSARAPEALLGVSASLLALDKKKAACQALDKLNSEFPSPSARVTKAAAIYSKRGGCS